MFLCWKKNCDRRLTLDVTCHQKGVLLKWSSHSIVKKSKVHLKYSFYHTHTPPPPPPPLFPLFTSFEPVLCKCESPTNLQTMQGSKFIQRKLRLIKRSVHQDKHMQRKDEKIIKGKKPAQGWIINVNEHAAVVVWQKGKNAILSN